MGSLLKDGYHIYRAPVPLGQVRANDRRLVRGPVGSVARGHAYFMSGIQQPPQSTPFLTSEMMERMTRRKPSARVASAGVTHTQLAVEDELGWLDAFVQGLILGLVTMKQQERIDKQRQVRGHRDIEAAVRVQHARLNTEVLRQVQMVLYRVNATGARARVQRAQAVRR